MAINVTVTEEIVNVNVSISTLANDIAAANALRAEQAADDAEAALAQVVPAVNQGLQDIEDAKDGALLDIGNAESSAIGNIGQAETDGLNAISGAESSALGNIGTAETNALNAINPLVSQAEGFKDDAEAAAIQTGLDAIATAADRVQTGLDVIDTNADVVTVTNFSNLILASQNTAIIQDLGSIDGTVDIDLLDGTLVIADLTDAVVFTFSGLPDNDKETAFTLRLSGLEQITFPVGTKFANGDVPTPEGSLYEIPCSIDSTGALIVYGVINDIKVP
jgi:hypothetical protein